MNSNTSYALPVGTVLLSDSYSYAISRVLGQGSFGITYLATATLLHDDSVSFIVAVKEFFMEQTNGREGLSVTAGNKTGMFGYYRTKFLHEARNLMKLYHPNIVKVVEAFEANGTAYYSMEYIDGGSLDSLIRSHDGLCVADTLRYTRDIGAALQCMHAAKMLHLDLKPSNVMLRDGHAVLIDFGYSKQYADDDNPMSSLTIGRGTPGYSPIEQDCDYRDSSHFPVTMDVYALGATMFKMLTGIAPPHASFILNSGFPYSELVAKGVDQRLIDVVSRAMAPMTVQRTPDVSTLLAQLDGIEEPVSQRKAAPHDIAKEATVVTAAPTAASAAAGSGAMTRPQPHQHIAVGRAIDKVVVVYREKMYSEVKECRYVVTPKRVSVTKGNPSKTFSQSISDDQFREFCDGLAYIATCKKSGDEYMHGPVKSVAITLFAGGKIAKSYSVETDASHSYGTLRDDADAVHSRIKDILPKRDIIERRHEKVRAEQEKKNRETLNGKAGEQEKKNGEMLTGKTDATSTSTEKWDIRWQHFNKVAGFVLTVGIFLICRAYNVWEGNGDMYGRFLDAVFHGIDGGRLEPMLALAIFGVGTFLLVLPFVIQRHIRAAIVAGAVCYATATLVCELFGSCRLGTSSWWVLPVLWYLIFAVPDKAGQHTEQ